MGTVVVFQWSQSVKGGKKVQRVVDIVEVEEFKLGVEIGAVRWR